ncbi:hypothetical protein N0V93_010306 [Gnomoniopsis smithogilvyi]|uniref:Uncharacterized protein n=1 Tax=Gnomoniopsis smithogilvyi TaxID=1191159 RepID=A0A9W9CRT1_9PEZI|nr:hypothetical protein N0V93_010306 [Gnomoniopsis smithogilvyi]
MRAVSNQFSDAYSILNFSWLNKGQAAAQNMCKGFDDPSHSLRRTQFWESLGDVKQKGSDPINYVIADHSGSTMALLPSGGSHSMNSHVLELVKEQIEDYIPPGELATIMQRWEEVKYRNDFITKLKPVVLSFARGLEAIKTIVEA